MQSPNGKYGVLTLVMEYEAGNLPLLVKDRGAAGKISRLGENSCIYETDRFPRGPGRSSSRWPIRYPEILRTDCAFGQGPY